jgi:hypothetical protein
VQIKIESKLEGIKALIIAQKKKIFLIYFLINPNPNPNLRLFFFKKYCLFLPFFEKNARRGRRLALIQIR